MNMYQDRGSITALSRNAWKSGDHGSSTGIQWKYNNGTVTNANTQNRNKLKLNNKSKREAKLTRLKI